jgi:hypothetical protein
VNVPVPAADHVSAATPGRPPGRGHPLLGTRSALVELAPLLRRAVDLDSGVLVRLRGGDAVAAVLRLPFGVLVGRTVPVARLGQDVDLTVRAADLLASLDDWSSLPAARDADWRGAIPPRTAWRRVETVPDHVVRGLVRQGARVLGAAAAAEGLPGAQPRPEIAEALLDSVVITARAERNPTGSPVEVTLGMLTAVTRMAFLPPGSHVALDVCGRWIRVAAEYGSAYLERPGLGLPVLR